MRKDNKRQKGLTDFLKEIAGIISGITTFAVTIDTLVRISQEGFNGQLPTILITGLILITFLGCFYFAFLWKPLKSKKHEDKSPLILLKPIQKKEYKNRKKFKNIAYLGVILIPFLIFTDLLSWSLIEKSYLWQNLYVIQLESQNIPEFLEECLNSKYGVKIRYPNSWNCQQAVNPFTQTILILNPKIRELENNTDVKIVVQLYPMPSLKSLDTFLEEHLHVLEKKRLNNFQLTSRNEITFVEKQGYKIEYQATENGRVIKYKEFLTLKNKQAYIVTYLANQSNFIKNERVAEKIATTLELLES